MIDWNEVSPGIFKATYEGFVMHKIEIGREYSGKITCKGERETVPVYNYIAIKPGSKGVEPVRFAGVNFDRIMQQVGKSLQTTLF